MPTTMRVATVLLCLLPAVALAQRELPDGYTGLVGCGAVWVVPTSDTTARVRPVTTRRCGRVTLLVEVADISREQVVLSVRARTPRETLRLPLRLFLDVDSLRTWRGGGELPRNYARLHGLVQGGDRPEGTHEVIDGWTMRLWRLDAASLEPPRIAALPRGGTTTPRLVTIKIATDSGRLDSLRVPLTVHALRPAEPMPVDPPLFDPAVHLRGRRVVHDTRRFPVPFYDGVVLLRFNAQVSAQRRQATLDRLQGRVIAVQPRDGGEPDYLVEPGAAWRDSLRQPGLRRLEREVRRFGIILEEPVPEVLPATPVDSTLITEEWDERCKLPSDKAVHRRAVLVSMRDGTAAERERLARLLGGRWLPSSDSTGFIRRLEMVGTRADVERRLNQMRRLPEAGFFQLNRIISFHGLACP